MVIANTLILILEISDKMPSVMENYLFFLAGGFGVMVLCRRWHWSAILAIALLFFFTWVTVSDLSSPSFRKDIIAEFGYNYIIHAYLAMSLSLLLSLAGFVMGLRRKFAK